MTWDELKASLNRESGDAPVTFESEGILFSVTQIDADGQVLLSARLAPVSDELSKEAVLRGMLEANHLFAGTGGASLSVDPETLQASIQQSVWIDLLDFESFMIRLEAFVSIAAEWKQKVADALAPKNELMPWPGNDGFIIA